MYKGRRVHFVVWMPAAAWSDATSKAYLRPILVLIFVIVLMIQMAMPTIWTAVVGLLGAFCTWRFINRYGGRYMRVWEHCSGFLILDEKGRPIRDKSICADFFKAYVTWEEAYLRPAVLQRLSKKALEFRFRVVEDWVLLGKQIELPRRGKLDMQVRKSHEALSTSEERIAAKSREEQVLAAEINNLLYLISEDMQIRRTELLRNLTRFQKFEVELADLIKKRIDEYEYWLALLDAKGFRVRYTLWGSMIVAVSAVVSALLSRTPLPLLLVILPAAKYLLDQLGGVRGLRRAATRHARYAQKVELTLRRLDASLDASRIRIPA